MRAQLRTGVRTGAAVLACLLAVAACGGSSHSKHSSSHKNVMLAFSECMRAHGISHFPDPGSGGGGLNLDGTGINTQSPSFRNAQSACFKVLPGGGPGGGKASAAQIRRAQQTAQCMRAHGVNGFPDPIIGNRLPANANPADYSSIAAGNGLVIAIPKSIDETSPAFLKAAKACQFSG
jgi:hypothetical protein